MRLIGKISIVFFIFVIAVFLTFLPMQIFAQEKGSDTQAPSQDLDVILSHGIQDAPSKGFDLIATITSNIDSDRVIVEWTLPAEFSFMEKYQFTVDQTTVAKGATQVVRARVKPDYQGIYKVEVKITAVKADVNYITTDSTEIEFNKSREIVPLSKEYKKDKLINQILNAFVIVVVLSGVTAGGIWLYKRYKIATSK